MRTVAALLACALGLAASQVTPDECPAGYTTTPGACLKYVGSEQLSWTAANARCALEEGFLAEFDTQNELDLLYAVCIGKRCWIGGNDVAQEGTWRWSSDNRQISPFVTSSWSTGEPNNCCGSEDCMHLWDAMNPDPSINDYACTRANRFLCQRPLGCPGGYYKQSATTCALCPAGRYQPSISIQGLAGACIPCAAGRYGTNTGETSPSCTGQCSAGYYCPSGSTSPTANICPAGKYGATQGLGTASCSGNSAPGHYTSAGSTVANPTSGSGGRCPAGKYGAGGASDPTNCSGPCQAGYFCPLASGSATQQSCGGVDRFCPEGSGSSTSVSAGHYTIPTSSGSANNRIGQQQCEPGYACNNGVRTACPAGTFVATAGATACTGVCQAGFYCPVASSVGTAEPCGGVNSFCPAGSGSPTTVSAGYYSTPESAATDQRTGQAQCAEDEFCTGGRRFKRIEFTSTCTTAVQGGVNAFADTYSVDENLPGATFASIQYTKRGSDALTVSMSTIPGGVSFEPGCPQTSAEMNALLQVNNNAGTGTTTISLKSGQAFNFEACSFYGVQITYELAAPTTTPKFTCTASIGVVDRNDRPNFVYDTRNDGSGTFLRQLLENARLRSAVPVLAATPGVDSRVNTADEDAGQEVRYEILSGNVGNSFAIGACSGQLFVNVFPISYEDRAVYNLVVRVTDNGSPPLSADVPVTITVLDVNEAPAFVATPYTLELEENLPAGTSLGASPPSIVQVVDEDAAGIDSVALTVLDADPARPPFALQPSGELVTTRVLDFEQFPDFDLDGRRDYRVIFTVTDMPITPGGNTFEVVYSQTITLLDTNDPPLLLNLGTAADPEYSDYFEIDEEVPDGTDFATSIQADDPDGDSIASITILGEGAGIFTASASTGNQWTLTKSGGRLDYETKPTYTFQIRLTDDDGADPRSSVYTITVSVRNVNEMPSVVPGQSVDLDENVGANVLTSFIGAVDPDLANGNEFLTWEVQGFGWVPAGGNASHSRLRPNMTLSYEAAQSHTVMVRVTDLGAAGAPLTSAWEPVTVVINNLNEPPAVVTGQVFPIAENPAGDSVVDTIAITDDDLNHAPTGETHVFSNLRGADLFNPRNSGEALFKLLPSGELRINDGVLVYPWQSGLDFETKASFTLEFTVTDAGIDGAAIAVDGSVVVQLTDVNEVPLVIPQNRSVLEQAVAGTRIGSPLTVLDQENTTITCDVATGIVGSVGNYNLSSTCQLRVETDLGDINDGESRFDVVSVTARDAAGQPHTASVGITVGSGNAKPVWQPTASDTLSVDEMLVNPLLKNMSAHFTDTDGAQSHQFFITQVVPSTAAGWFALDQTSGALQSTSATNFEQHTSVTLTLEVQDDGPGQLRDEVDVTINILNVNEAPVINTTALHTTFSLAETDITGIASAVVGTLAASDVDGTETLTFSLSDPSGNFAVATTCGAPCNTAQGGITIAASAGGGSGFISHEALAPRAAHVFTATVTDSGGLNSSTTIRVTVTDLNEPPVLQKTWAGQPEAFTIPEDISGETPASNRRLLFVDATGRGVDARANAVDPDVNDPVNFGRLTYRVVPGSPDADTFRTDTNGVVRVRDGVVLNFEDRSSYTVTIEVCDFGTPAECDDHTFPVTITDVPDVTVTDIYTYDSSTGERDVLVPTAGSSNIRVYFRGLDFANPSELGTLALRAEGTYHDGTDEPPSPVTLDRTAPGMCMLHNTTTASCLHPPGIGQVSWELFLDGVQGNKKLGGAVGGNDAAGRTKYMPPTITSVTTAVPDGKFDTRGGQVFSVVGTNFGPLGTVLPPVTIRYGPNSGLDESTLGFSGFTAASCTMVTAHTAMDCVTSEGWSTQLSFVPRIGGQGGQGLATTLGYHAPNISSIIMNTGSGLASTTGGSTFTVLGSNFGPANHGLAVRLGTSHGAGARFSAGTCSSATVSADRATYRYEAVDCLRSTTSPHSALTCAMPPGSGTGHVVEVRMFPKDSSLLRAETLQTSRTTAGSATVRVSYEPPSLVGISGPGVFRANTKGNQLIIVQGSNLGRVPPCQGASQNSSEPACTRVGADRAGASADEQPILRYAKTLDIAANGVSGARWYTAGGCVVRSTGIAECCSAVGTGKGFTYRLTIDGQESTNMLELDASGYHPPLIQEYRVNGQDPTTNPPLSPTKGGYAVQIIGAFFGPDTSTLESVRYGLVKEFAADVSQCTMLPNFAHSRIECKTVQGAGSNMVWTLTVDGQESELPTTDYGAPVITSFQGEAAANASTAGGQEIIIKGRNFGPLPTPGADNATQLAPGEFPTFLDFVRYGAVTGLEYRARDCVVQDHWTIRCLTAPGSGSDLIWTVSVEGQVSETPSVLWSYAKPELGAFSLIDGAQVTTAGGVRARMLGTNFASADVETKLRVRITVPYYSFMHSPEFLDYLRSDGVRFLGPAEAWEPPADVPAFTDIAVTGRVWTGARGRALAQEAVEFTLPPGVGTGVQVQLVQVPKGLGIESATLSDPITFDYAPPGPPIGLSTPGFLYRTADLGADTTRITITGSSLGRTFGSGSFFDGFVYVDGTLVPPENIELWSHGEIKVRFTKAGSSGATAGNASADSLVDNHFHVRVDLFDRIDTPELTNDTLVCGSPPAYNITTIGSNNQTVVTEVSNCTIEAVPTGVFGPSVPEYHSSSAVVVATSPSLGKRVDDGTAKPTIGGGQLAFTAKNIGNDTSLMYVTVGENAVLQGPTDGVSPVTARERNNTCVVTNIDYDEVAREGTVYCTLPEGQGEANILRFYWNNKSPDANNASSALDIIKVKYATPTITGVSATADPSAPAPPQQSVEAYVSGPSSFNVLRFVFPTEGGELTVSGVNLGMTGGLGYFSQVGALDGRPLAQFDGMTQQFGIPPPGQEPVTSSYARVLNHTHTLHRVAIPPSMNLQPSFQHLLRYRHCAAVGCPTFSSVLPDCSGLTSTPPGQVCDTPDSRVETNTEFAIVSDKEERDELFDILSDFVTTYPNPGTGLSPNYISYSYAPPTVDAAASSLTSTTRGGGTLVLYGLNFGPADAQPLDAVRVTVGGNNCTLLRDGTGARVVNPGQSAHREVHCTMPEGVGRQLPVSLQVGAETFTIPTAASQVSYLPPEVHTMWPSSGPTSGLDESGARIRVWLTGDNFGNDPNAVLVWLRSNPSTIASGAEVDVRVPAADINLYNHTHLSFLVPEGQGSHKIVEVVVAGQSTRDAGTNGMPGAASWPSDGTDFSGATWAALAFRYDDPIITSVRGSITTRGGVLTLNGANFGRPNCGGPSFTVNVTMTHSELPFVLRCGADEFCASHNHERLQCRVPAGVGSGYDLNLLLGGRSVTRPGAFSYLPPRIEDVSPTPARADVDFELTIVGQNFGAAGASPVNVSIGGVPCENARVVPSEATTLDVLKCTSKAQTIGPKNITLDVAYQNRAYDVQAGWVELHCPIDMYGQVGELCLPCPVSGVCFNHAVPDESCLDRVPNVGCMLYREPISAPTAWLNNETVPFEYCPGRESRPGNFTKCPVMVGCDPPEACAGNNLCSKGYDGNRCGVCAVGYFKLDGECQECPDLGWLFIMLFIVGILAVCAVGMLLNRYKVNLAFISIGVDYFQVLGLFARAKVAWPRIIKDALSALSVFNLNIDLAAPECASPDMTYTQKWLGVMLLPIIIFTVFFLAYLAKYIYKRWIKQVKPESRNSHAPMLVSTSLLMFYLLYLYLTRTTFDIFNCSPTFPDDGYLYLEAVFERCWVSETHNLLFPLAIVTCIVYVIAYPVCVFYLLRKNRDTVKIDQILRAKNIPESDFAKEVPVVYAFRKSFSKMYYQFKPGKWYWQPVIVARKFAIAVTSLMFRSTPSFQMAMIVMVLFFAFAAQVKQVPYMSTSERRAEELYHEQKVLQGDPRHMKLNEDVKMVVRKLKKRTKARTMDRIKEETERAPTTQFLTNFNTVETVLLTCAILVAMAAILFQSRRLQDGRSPEVREALVWLTLLVIFGSIVYFLVIAFIEISDTVAPQMFATCCKCCKAKKSTIELEAERGMAGLQAATPTSADTAFNPLLAGSLAQEKAKHAMSAEEVSAILEMLNKGQVPNHPQWQAVRTYILRQRQQVTDATNELRGLKKAATVASAKASLSSNADERKKRRPKGRGKSKRDFAQAAARRSTVGRKAVPGLSKTSANRLRGQ